VEFVSHADGGTRDSGPVSSGGTARDSTAQSGQIDFLATMGLVGDMQLNAALTASPDGSLNLDGQINFSFAPAVDYHVLGDIVVDYNYDTGAGLVQLAYRPLDLPGMVYPGLLMEGGPFADSL